MHLNLTQVKTYLAVIETGGFQEAGVKLGLSQPTITQHVKKLEASLGATLIERNHTGCKPTDAGRAFIGPAHELLKLEKRAVSAVTKNEFVIGASSNIGTYYLPMPLSRFVSSIGHSTQPRVVMETNPSIGSQLSDGLIDIALMEWWDDQPGFVCDTWARERLVVITATDHPWAGRDTISSGEFLGASLIGGESGSGTATVLRRCFGARAEALNVSMTLSNTEAVKRAVIAGLGVSLVLEGAVADEVAAGQLHSLNIEEYSLHKDLVAVRPDRYMHDTTAEIAAAFVSEIQDPVLRV